MILIEEQARGAKRAEKMRTIHDHKGRVYPSLVAMCRAYGVPKSTYLWRMHQGWGIEGALTLGGSAERGGCPSRFRQSRRRAA